jgi:WXG100 family type VII secretion target
MCADSTQVDYEQLAQIVKQFICEGESIAEVEAALRRDLDALCGRQWMGVAADSFQREMLTRSLPGLHRLAEALLQAGARVDKIGKIYREHEEEAAALFRSQEDGAAPRLRPESRGGTAGIPPQADPVRTKGEIELEVFKYDALKNKSGLDLELGLKYGVDRAVYERKSDDGFDIFGGGGGLEVGAGKKGFNAGVYGEGYLVKGDVDGVFGNDRLGVVGGLGINAVTAEAFAGIRHNSVGWSVGGKLASIEGKVGVNIAGINVNVFGEVGAKAELGFSVGAKTQVKLPFFSLGISFGKAEAN